MTTQATKVPAFGQQLKYSPANSIWNNRLVHFLQTGQSYSLGFYSGLFALSVSCGAIASTAILRNCRSAKDFHSACYGMLLLTTLYGTTALIGQPTMTTLTVVIVIFTGLASGFELVKKYYGTVEQESCERVQSMTKKTEYHRGWDVVWIKEYDRYADLRKFREELLKSNITENQLNYLLLNDLGLTDVDLNRFKEAQWLEHLKLLDLSNKESSSNKVSAQAVLYCGDELEILKLTNCDLTDEDLRQLAESGKCRNVKWLALGNNPKITWEGVMKYLGGDKFSSLERLDLSGNLQLKGKPMKEWIDNHPIEQDRHFKYLKSMELMDMELTAEELEPMIAHFPWFQNLEGLNLCNNSGTLTSFPPNILDLKTILPDPPGGGGPSGGWRPFNGKAIFVSCVLNGKIKITPTVKQLFGEGKLTSPHC